MPRFEINPDLQVPDSLAARRTVELWQSMSAGEPFGEFFTEDYLLEGSPLRIAMLPEGQSGNEEAIANADRLYPDTVVRLQDVVATTDDAVMSVLAVDPGSGEHAFVVYIVSQLTGDRFSGTQAFTDLREARQALAG